MTDHSIRVLLVDGQVEDSHWVHELLAELEESRYGGGWARGMDVFHVDRLADATAILGERVRNPFDVVLLNPSLPDSTGLRSYLRLQASAPHVPVVILSEFDDPDLAVSMTRAGAQDFLAKSQLDSVPLARSLRLAVERTRILSDLRAQSNRDDLTGFANCNGFEAAAERDLTAAHRLGHSFAVMIVEVTGLDQLAQSYGRDEQHLALIEAAEVLRGCAPMPAILARVTNERFAVGLLAASVIDIASMHALIARRMQMYLRAANRSLIRVRHGSACYHSSARTPMNIGDLLKSALDSLCENKGDFNSSLLEKGPHSTQTAYATGAGRDL
jgi:diguanylate cyclase (GGDEF)-like protein